MSAYDPKADIVGAGRLHGAAHVVAILEPGGDAPELHGRIGQTARLGGRDRVLDFRYAAHGRVDLMADPGAVDHPAHLRPGSMQDALFQEEIDQLALKRGEVGAGRGLI